MGRSAPDHATGAGYYDGKTPFQLQTGVLAFSTASQIKQAAIVAPCDAVIVAAQMRTLASATGASSQFNIGKNASASALFTQYGVAQLASTLTDLFSASTWVAAASLRTVSKGDVIYVNLKKSTAVGKFAVSLFFMPR